MCFRYRCLGIAYVLFYLFSLPISTIAQTITARDINKYAVYHLVRQAAYVGRLAAERDQQDGTGKNVRHAFSATVGLSDGGAETLFALAEDFDAKVAALDKQAAEVSAKAKKNRTSQGLIPPPPPELVTLQNQKMALVNSLSGTLLTGLDRDSFSAVASFLQRKTAISMAQGANGMVNGPVH